MEEKNGLPDTDTDQETTPAASEGKWHPNEIYLSSLQELKAIFLAIDWEINDQTLTKLIDESEKLMNSSEGDLVLMAYFKMLASLGKYIKAHKANSDKDALGLLRSVYEGMEKVIATDEMPYQERERLVIDEINKFQVLKQKIAGPKAGHPPEKQLDQTASDSEINDIKADVASLHQNVNELREQITRVLEALDR
ncbi:MAG: hypothetical protein U9Q05_13845 [Thermodesulfobacteriota bacterium]|nr:hypothetical protein [Thermodesulfobacteriota bacterium]